MTLKELEKAVKDGCGISELSHFIAFGGDVNAGFPDSESNLLHLAIEHENLPMITALFNAGADIEARDSNGWTPLHHAVDFDIDSAGQTSWEEGDFLRNLSFKVTGLIASLGADFNSQLKSGETPRDIASHYGEEVLRKYDEVITEAVK